MLRQYFATKERYPGVLIAMRVGDFYEFYGEDAEVAARTLEITLTGREDGPNGRIAMSGVPYHSVEKYLARLIGAGFKVALCDQVEDPKQAKGLVKREVTRVLTPGTVLEESMLPQTSNNFLASAVASDEKSAVSFLDLSTGEFLVTEVCGPDAEEKTIQEILRLNPSECLLPEEAEEFYDVLSKLTKVMVTRVPNLHFKELRNRVLKQFGTQSLMPFGIEDLEIATRAAGNVLHYLDKNSIESGHIDSITTYSLGEKMRLDFATLRSLELTSNMVDGTRKHSLISTIDFTKTPMGGRNLKRWIEEPMLNKEIILERLDSVEHLKSNGIARQEIRDVLETLYDIPRLVSRCATGTANARDLVALKTSLGHLPELITATMKIPDGRIVQCRRDIDECEELFVVLGNALVDDPPLSIRDGGMIRDGYDYELDAFRKLVREGKEYIAGLETAERESTGIEKLKVGFNSVFGFYLEVPKSMISKVPDRFIRKQTTANGERYITAELKEYESKVMGSEEKASEIEMNVFRKLREKVAEHSSRLLKTARSVSEIDVLQSLGEVAARFDYVKPKISDESKIEIRGGRHPVVESQFGLGSFVPNDVKLTNESSFVVLTGPNMSGKSTYLRQTALICLLIQIGSFVPAEFAEIGLIDRIFARIGARDELASGQSTFMVEMTEAANILHHASEKSLVILDEIGRGTSTFDGLAIAWAISEHLSEKGTKTLFATHYHQLNHLAEQLSNVKNFRVSVREEDDRVIWLHKVLEGGTDRSYGIQVARMAGIPRTVLERAGHVLAELEGKEVSMPRVSAEPKPFQFALFEPQESPIIKRIREIDTATMTPVEALVMLDELKKSTSDSK